MPDRGIRIEVVYASPERQMLLVLEVETGTTVREAIRRSGIAPFDARAGFEEGMVGIFGKVVSADTVLRDGDRIEIYRSLRADPKEMRRRRAHRRD